MNLNATSPNNSQGVIPAWLELAREKVAGLRYGVIELVVHDGHVTQIETTEKTRVPNVRD